jgi:hypothetical protein
LACAAAADGRGHRRCSILLSDALNGTLDSQGDGRGWTADAQKDLEEAADDALSLD